MADCPQAPPIVVQSILFALCKVLRAKGLLTDDDAAAVSAEAFDIMRGPIVPEFLDGPEKVERMQQETLALLQPWLLSAGLPAEFLPLDRG